MTDTSPRRPFEPPRSTSGSPVGGAIGPAPEHFFVEEIPAYPLSGEGEHCFLWIEKRGVTTTEVAKRLARASGIRERDIGFAGMKDKQAVTRQWYSLCSPQLEPQGWDLGEGVTLLETTRHKNKLRTGHLIGNRFAITLVGVPDGALERAQEICGELQKNGLPNYFGPQRFGHGGKNLEEALLWLDQQKVSESRADQSAQPVEQVAHSVEQTAHADAGAPERRSRSRNRKKGRNNDTRFENKLMPSVIQSEIFNRYIALRLERPEPLLLGEVVRLDGAGKSFVVEDLAAELPRRLSGDIHLTGPMPGPKALHATDDALALEELAISGLGLDDQARTILAKHAPGARRDLVLYPEELKVSQDTEGELRVHFTLPAGAYATQLMREFSGADWQSPRGAASL